MTATAKSRRPGAAESPPRKTPDRTPAPRGRLLPVALAMLLMFAAIGGQMLNLALATRNEARLQSAEPIVRVHARPDIVDRHGRIIATDVDAASLFADPALLLDLDEIIEKLTLALPTLDEAELRRSLSDRSRRFAWIKRGMAPVEAQRVHELGLPGLACTFESSVQRARAAAAARNMERDMAIFFRGRWRFACRVSRGHLHPTHK